MKNFCLGLCLLACAAPVNAADPVQRNPSPSGSGLILDSVTVNPGAKLLFISGKTADKIDEAAPNAGYGDTRTQTIGALSKIRQAVERQGLTIADVIRLTIYVVEDPKLGKPDYAGMNAGYREIFGTASNANVVARSAVEIRALQSPGILIEIDAIAAR